MGFGIALMRLAAFGTDPYSCMNIGIGVKTALGFGTWQLILNGLLMVLVFFTDRRKIGFGTLFNMLGVGYLADFFLRFFRLIPGLSLWPVRILALPAGIIPLCFGASLYMEAALGLSPYDAVGVIISEKLGKPGWFRWIRIITDLCCVFIGFISGSAVGIGTVICAFFTGPLMVFFRRLWRTAVHNAAVSRSRGGK
ncbi:MAG: hypothetical protein LBT95_00955 [Treponema sp.]|jgi:uncharacterized membrane protein YczE|nr:hypothetical protein [Treponema sp.]